MNHIYILRCPESGLIRYVGNTKHPKTRLKQHIKDAENRQNTEKQRWIKNLREKGLIPEMEILEKIENDELARKVEEETVIKYIDTVFNIHMPGKGSKSTSFYKKNKKLK